MNRRGFFAGLAGLPLIGKLAGLAPSPASTSRLSSGYIVGLRPLALKARIDPPSYSIPFAVIPESHVNLDALPPAPPAGQGDSPRGGNDAFDGIPRAYIHEEPRVVLFDPPITVGAVDPMSNHAVLADASGVRET